MFNLSKLSTSKFLYHITFTGRLDGIRSEGLIPNSGNKGIGNSTLDAHKSGKFFACEFSGVPVWYEKAIIWAEYNSDDYVDEGWVPVVLRFPNPNLKTDHIGENDSGYPAIASIQYQMALRYGTEQLGKR